MISRLNEVCSISFSLSLRLMAGKQGTEDDSAGFSLSLWERVGERGEATEAGSE